MVSKLSQNMYAKPLHNDNQYHWTSHVKGKMAQYGLSASLIKRIIKFPKRREEGVASNTIAVMQTTTSKKSQEIWVMYKIGSGKLEIGDWKKRKKKIIISAWRYPGVSPVGKAIHIPDDVLEELEKWFQR